MASTLAWGSERVNKMKKNKCFTLHSVVVSPAFAEQKKRKVKSTLHYLDLLFDYQRSLLPKNVTRCLDNMEYIRLQN